MCVYVHTSYVYIEIDSKMTRCSWGHNKGAHGNETVRLCVMSLYRSLENTRREIQIAHLDKKRTNPARMSQFVSLDTQLLGTATRRSCCATRYVTCDEYTDTQTRTRTQDVVLVVVSSRSRRDLLSVPRSQSYSSLSSPSISSLSVSQFWQAS